MIDEDEILYRTTEHVRSDEQMVPHALTEEATDEEVRAIHRSLHNGDYLHAGHVMAATLARAERAEIARRFEAERENAMEEEADRKRNAERFRLGPTESEARSWAPEKTV